MLVSNNNLLRICPDHDVRIVSNKNYLSILFLFANISYEITVDGSIVEVVFRLIYKYRAFFCR